MSTADQRLSAAITGEALRAAQSSELQPVIDHLASICEGRDDLRIEAAGELAGWWFASPASAPHWGYELIAAGLLLVAGIHDGDRLEASVRDGFERRVGNLRGHGPTG